MDEAFTPVKAGDLLHSFRRLIDLNLRDDVAGQAVLVDSLMSASALGSDGRTMAIIMQARMAIVNGIIDEASLRWSGKSGQAKVGTSPTHDHKEELPQTHSYLQDQGSA